MSVPALMFSFLCTVAITTQAYAVVSYIETEDNDVAQSGVVGRSFTYEPSTPETGVAGVARYSTGPLSRVRVNLVRSGEDTPIPSTTVYTDQEGRYTTLRDTPGDCWVKAFGGTTDSRFA